MNLSKMALNKYLNKIYARAGKYLRDEITGLGIDVVTEIEHKLDAGVSLGIFQDFDGCGGPMDVLQRPFLGGCYYDPDEHLQEFKDSIIQWLTPEAKKTLGIEEKSDESVKEEAH